MNFLQVLCVTILLALANGGPWNYYGHSFGNYYRKLWRHRYFRRLTTTTTSPSTPTTTTETTSSTHNYKLKQWQIDLTNQVRRKYELTQRIQIPMLYGFTEEEAKNFTSRINDEVVLPNPRNCSTKDFPKFTEMKIQEVKEIINNSKCANNKSNSDTTTQIPPATITNIQNQPQQILGELRSNPNCQISPGSEFRNSDGSVTRIVRCLRRGQTTRNNNIQLCTECQAVTTLPENSFPRFINEIICNPSDKSCLSSGGNCVEGNLNIPFLKDTQNLGPDRLGEWEVYQQSIRTSCSCGVAQNSVFMFFV